MYIVEFPPLQQPGRCKRGILLLHQHVAEVQGHPQVFPVHIVENGNRSSKAVNKSVDPLLIGLVLNAHRHLGIVAHIPERLHNPVPVAYIINLEGIIKTVKSQPYNHLVSSQLSARICRLPA